MKLAYCCSIYTWFIHKYCCLQMLWIGGSASFGGRGAFDYAGWCRTLLTPAACIALKHLRQHCCKQPNTQTQTPTNQHPRHATPTLQTVLHCTILPCILCTVHFVLQTQCTKYVTRFHTNKSCNASFYSKCA